MPSQLITNDNVEFICGRNFTYNGEDFEVGDFFPQEKALNIEVLVRTRHLIPVVESTDVKPRHWHREVRIKSEILEKLGKTAKPAKKTAAKKTAAKEPK